MSRLVVSSLQRLEPWQNGQQHVGAAACCCRWWTGRLGKGKGPRKRKSDRLRRTARCNGRPRTGKGPRRRKLDRLRGTARWSERHRKGERQRTDGERCNINAARRSKANHIGNFLIRYVCFQCLSQALLERIPSSLPRWCPSLRAPAEYARLCPSTREYADSSNFLQYSVVPSHTLPYSVIYLVIYRGQGQILSVTVTLPGSLGAHLPVRGSQCSSPLFSAPTDIAPYRLRYAAPFHLPGAGSRLDAVLLRLLAASLIAHARPSSFPPSSLVCLLWLGAFRRRSQFQMVLRNKNDNMLRC